MGAKPIFVDCKDDFCINEELIEKITKKTKAILPVHFTGYVSNMNYITRLSKKYNIELMLKMHVNQCLELTMEKMWNGRFGAFHYTLLKI